MDVGATVPGASNPGTGTTSRSELGRDDFLKLLITQMRQQDPLDPADSQQFLAQLAQFSNLEQLVAVNAKLDTLALAQASLTSATVANLIGRTVTVRGDSVELGEGDTPSLRFDLPQPVESLTVTIRDEQGRVVRTMELGAHPAGDGEIVWDGRDQDGNRLPAGRYSFSVSGFDEQGQPVEASGRVSGTVTGINYDQGFPQLLLGQMRVSLGDVIEIL